MESSSRLRPLLHLASCTGAGLVAILCGGCEHEDRVIKGRAQKAEIQQLTLERDRLDEKRKPYDASRAKELAATKEELARTRQILERLDKEVAAQEKTKAEVEKAATAYRASHPLKNP